MSECLFSGLNSTAVPWPGCLRKQHSFVSYCFLSFSPSLFPMSSPVSIAIHAEEQYHHNIRRNGFVTCVVTLTTPPFQSLRLAFCLHCRQLRSYTGCLKHSKQLQSKHRVELSRPFNPEKIDEYKLQINAEVEQVCEKLLRKVHNHSRDTSCQPEQSSFPEAPTSRETVSPIEPSQIDEEPFLSGQSAEDHDFSEEVPEQDPLYEQEWDCFEDCLLSRWSCSSGLNSESRFEQAETVLEVFCDDEDKRRRLKSRVLTLMIRQLSSYLSLTKTQKNQIVHFMKGMLCFVSPENQGISQKIFACHDS